MNNKIKKIINTVSEKIKENFPELKFSDLEESGVIYYMNDQNGTAFDWSMNEHLSPFMCFYKDGSCGALKMDIYDDGEAIMYFYQYKAKSPFKEIRFNIFNESETYDLAVLLFHTMDQKGYFGKSIELCENIEITDKEKNEFEEFFN